MKKKASSRARLPTKSLLAAVVVVFAAQSLVGIDWGLPSRDIDPYLFGDSLPWSGEKIYRLAGDSDKFNAKRGADVDADPLIRPLDGPVPLTATESDIAKIYLRYRLYTYQPDEMITMMALAGMRPGQLNFDPKLYQYGGLFVYPVGALIRACGALGLIEVRNDIVYYLDHPDEFAKFYLVARAYAAAWGIVGALAVFGITRRLGGDVAALLAALLFTLLPVVTCMAHEGKPHLPGAALMLLAVLFGMRCLARAEGGMKSQLVRKPSGDSPPECERNTERNFQRTSLDWWLMCACCGAALGMVLSSWPIFVLIPLTALLELRMQRIKTNVAPRQPIKTVNVIGRTMIGGVVAIAIYLVTNPYVPINALFNREVLQSNFGNSLGMYEMTQPMAGLVRVGSLTIEGATMPVLLLGLAGWGVLALRKPLLARQRGRWPTSESEFRPTSGVEPNARMGESSIVPLMATAIIFFAQFVLIGANKPAEYGRFGIFTNTALVIGTACLLGRLPFRRRAVAWLGASLVVGWISLASAAYTMNFLADARGTGSRLSAIRRDDVDKHAEALHSVPDEWWAKPHQVAVVAEPAPYACPPLNFQRAEVLLFRDHAAALSHQRERGNRTFIVRTVDHLGQDTSASMIDRRANRRPSSVDTVSWWRKWLFRRETSISWANKPISVEGPVEIDVSRDQRR